MPISKSLLFSEEKRSKKDFIRLRACQAPWHAHKRAKVFWFFFSKKNRFLPYAKGGRAFHVTLNPSFWPPPRAATPHAQTEGVWGLIPTPVGCDSRWGFPDAAVM